ncbi:MAG: thiamine pyrophosphate-dependent enzyme [Candidatus Methanofastidiosia archaeon]
MASLKVLSEREERLTGGHRLCAGCGASIIVRQVLLATDYPVVITCATGCLEVSTTIYPYTAWKTPFMHNAFENSAATISGAESMFNVLKKTGKIPKDKKVKFIAFGGDGGTYDIGLQSLSGALERGHDFLYVCYNNEAYMNTGIQRSSATPMGAATTTSPAGTVIPGKKQFPKDLTEVIAGHHLPYVAQASPGYHMDLIKKVEKAMEIEGPKFMNTISPCPRGWRHVSDGAVEVAKLAVDTCFWPLYEIIDDKYYLTGQSKSIAAGRKEKKPITDYLKTQGRFKHLLSPKNKDILDRIQEEIDRRWKRLIKLSQL